MKKEKKPKVAWGIAGAGEKMVETLEMMKKIKKEYEDVVDIDVYISRSGDQVIKYYGISNEIETNFNNIWVEINANSPFLAGQIQLGKYEFMLIAPCSANTVAKIALRMGDTLLANSAIMGQRADIKKNIIKKINLILVPVLSISRILETLPLTLFLINFSRIRS